MSRAEVYYICLDTVPATLSRDAIDAIIDCAVQEAVKEMWHQLDDMADRVMREV